MIRFIRSEYEKIKKNYFTIFSALMILLFILYIFIDYKNSDINISGYIISSSLLSLTVIGVLFPVLIGALIFGNDYDWNTYYYMMPYKTKVNIYIKKIFSLLVFIILLVIFILIYSCLMNILSNKFMSIFPSNVAEQIFTVSLFMYFWGTLAVVTVLFSKSILIGVIIPILWSFGEYFIYGYVSNGIKRLLPLFNLKNILYFAFNNLESGSMIIVPDNGFTNCIYSYIYIMFALIILLTTGAIIFIKSEVKC